jgi:5-(carboxyamino)imidazole ribonucleotide mutase
MSAPSKSTCRVVVLSGSTSDEAAVDACAQLLDDFEVAFERRVLSAHRQPAALREYVAEVEARGVQVFVCMAGMAAHLPGVVASMTHKPVLGVPLKGGLLDGLDALLSVVQMPGGIPVACLAVGTAGAKNAAVLALEILALSDAQLAARLAKYRAEMGGGAR